MRRMRSCLAWLGSSGGDRSGIGDGVAARDRGAAPAATFPNGWEHTVACRCATGRARTREATRAVEVRHQGELLGGVERDQAPWRALTPIEQKARRRTLRHQAGLVLKTWV